MPQIFNPANWELLEKYNYINREELDFKIQRWNEAFKKWKLTSFEERKNLFLKLASLMIDKKENLAKTSTKEMWMLYKNSLWDVSKSASWITYFANNFSNILNEKEFSEWWISWKIIFEPLWLIYSISPWNFPYNQVFRNAVPNILAWNTILSKHASNVVWCSRLIEELFLEAWFPVWVYQNLVISSNDSEYIISNNLVKWTNITWWDKAWRIVWKLAWEYIKPSILELWWNDPFLLLDTNDLDKIVELAVVWRLTSCWQKCSSSKRFIILEKYYEDFCNKLKEKFESLIIWDPFDEKTDIWPLAKIELLDELEYMVEDSLSKWAKLLTWWKRLSKKWFYFKPTIVSEVRSWMKLFDEESFWPVASIIKADNINDAIEKANNSRFWLASTVITADKDLFNDVSKKLETWNVFWNKIPTSYPFLPYWWVKDSWYWKELWENWLKNFVIEKVIVY